MSWLLWPAQITIEQTMVYGQAMITEGELRHTGAHECLVTNNLRPNALLLPVPTNQLSPRFKSLVGGPCLLRDLAAVHYPGLHKLPRRPPNLEYTLTRTIIVADPRPETFAAALKASSLPHQLQPEINEEPLAQFAERYPGWPLLARLIAPTSTAEQAIPLPRLLYNYEPVDPGRLFFPTAEPRYNPADTENIQPMHGLTDVVAMLGHNDGDRINYCSTPPRGSLLPEGVVSLYLGRRRPPGNPQVGQTFGDLWVATRDITRDSLPEKVAAHLDQPSKKPLYFVRKPTTALSLG